MKKIVAVFLAVCLLIFGAAAVSAEETVASGTCGDNLTWVLTDDGVLTISGSGAMADYSSASATPWYSNRSAVTAVVIESGVTSIGDRAFYNFTALADVTIGSDVTTIGTYAFRGCTALEEVSIPASVTEVEASAFRASSNLAVVTFGGNAPTVGNYVFTDCSSSLTVQYYEGSTGYDVSPWTDYAQVALHVGEWIVDSEVTCTTDGVRHIDCSYCQETITETVTAPGHQYVNGVCTVCQEVEERVSGVCGANLTWKLDVQGLLTISGTGEMYNYSYYSNNSVKRAPWYSYRNYISSLVIEEGVTSIGSYAFYEISYIDSVSIPDSVTTINYSAFEKCSDLKEITIPANLTLVGSWAFYDCDSLTDVYISDPSAWCNVNFAGNYAAPGGKRHFLDEEGNELTEVVLDSTVTKIPVSAFKGSILTSITIPEGVTSIGDNAFASCGSLTSITIPESVASIGEYAFWNCSSLTSVTILEGVTSIGYSAFDGCSSLTSITLPESVISIGEYAFDDCSSLTSVRLPESVISIGDYAFDGCSSLTSVTIPEGVTSIGSGVFGDCSSLTSVTIPESVTSIGYSAFDGCSSLTSIAIPESVTSIGNTAFCDCSSLTSITIPEGVTSIGDYTFMRCRSLTSIAIPESVTSIGQDAFFGCSSLTSITIPESVTSIGNSAFGSCSSLTSITIPEGVSSIGDKVFYGCSSLTSVTIPESVSSIGDWAFSDCSSLTSITIPESVTSIGEWAFSDCSNLVEITIPNSVTTINYCAFRYCSSLVSIAIPESVTSISDSAFSNCLRLQTVIFEGAVPSISNYAFLYVTASAYYPGDDDTWTSSKQANYGGTLTWVAVSDHEHSYEAKVIEPTCILRGYTVHTCPLCGDNYVDEYVEATGHSYTAVVTEPTCAEMGYTTYTCDACGHSYYADYVDTIAHNYGEWSVVTASTCTENGVQQRECQDCGNVESESLPMAPHYVEVVTGTGIVDAVTMTNDAVYPFKESDGWYSSTNKSDRTTSIYTIEALYDCTFVLKYYVSSEKNYDKLIIVRNSTTLDTISGTVSEKTLTIELAAGDVLSIKYSKDANTSGGADTGYFKIESFESIERVPVDEVEADCQNPVVCAGCQQVVKEAGHSYEAVVTAPTCTEQGYTTYTCHCGDSYVGDYVDAAGHSYESVVTKPTTTAGGYTTHTCTICGDSYVDSYTDPVKGNPFTDVPEGKYYFEPIMWAVENGVTSGRTPTYFGVGETCTRAQIVTFLWRAMGKPEPTTTVSPFTDVQDSSAYYYDAVLWAVETGVTSGRTPTYFGVTEDCTRAQIVTFLWRAMGKPEPTNTVSKFPDVQNSNAYYYKAVLWAVEEGITSGMADGTFGVENACTREQCVTFLHRALADE